MYNKWTNREIEYLKENYSKLGYECSKYLNRDIDSIQNKVNRLNLTRENGRWTQDEAIQKSLDIGATLIGKYKGGDKKIKFKCPQCGEIFLRTPNSVWNIKLILCTECGIKQRSQKITLTQQEAKKKIEENGWKLLGEYINCDTKVKAQCSCNKIILIRPNSIFNGKAKTCGHCNDPNIGDKFGKLVVKEVFPSNNGGCNVICICECGNIWKGKFSCLNNKHSITSCGHCEDPSIGDKFGKLTVIKVIPSRANGCNVKCVCECGEKWNGTFAKIKSGNTKSCGHCNDPNIGDKFGKLTIIKVYPKSHSCSVECKCDCGGKWKGGFYSVRNGNTKSCGCISSNGEEIIKQILNELNIKYKRQHTFPDLRGLGNGRLRIDFWLEEIKVAIECNGKQHYNIGTGLFSDNEKFEQRKKHDNIKREYLKSRGYKYIEIPYLEKDGKNLEKFRRKVIRILKLENYETVET